jgi:beta-galactosidase/beta-glucuronidase
MHVEAEASPALCPRAQLVRAHWAELGGTWQFEYDDLNRGLDEGWMSRHELSRTIEVPFPPESPASGIGDTGYHRLMWYRRVVSSAEIAAAGHASDRQLMLHFGAVDYRADVWVNGTHVASHEGGHTPFSATVRKPGNEFEIVVRVEDDPRDLGQPRGKQDWQEQAHVVWYDRTSGIWQPVWLESVPKQHVAHLTWRPDVVRASVGLSLELADRPIAGTRATVVLRLGDRVLAEQTFAVTEPRGDTVIAVEALRNGQDLQHYLWSPECPTLVDATIELEVPGNSTDVITSYFGFRDVGAADGRFMLNGRPYEIRAVLAQGFWPQSHLAAPSADALRAEVELIRELGFTTVRMHQKIEDPRFLYWADRLGLLVWEELPSAYEFSAVASTRLTSELTEVIRRDSSHPSVVVWVPFNESWGVQHVASDPQQQQLVRALYHYTKSLDPTRLVISNDGWEHIQSDLLTIHDYENDAEKLRATYGTSERVRLCLDGLAPNGRRVLIGMEHERAYTAARPVVLTEFGGVSIRHADEDDWGYELVDSHHHLERHLEGLFAVVHGTESLAGWCYTQLTDTAQETNGLTDQHRVPKLPAGRIHAIVQGGDYRPVPAEPQFEGAI